jgi:3-hydroxybutyryl-CoA dehydrogenase
MRIFLTGNDSINSELKETLSGKAEFTEMLNNETDAIFETTNFPKETKLKNLAAIEEKSNNSIPVFTSSLCVTVSEQSAACKYPSRLIGIGLYNTFSKAKRIEIAPSKITDEGILKNAEKFLTDSGIIYSIVPDRAGMIFPRIISMIINEAAQVYSEQIASKEDIDTAMKLGTNYPNGPLEWADRLGVELVYEILSALQRDFGEDRYRPHPVLKEMVNMKKGFYS